jgi:hypothetical protein
MYSDLPTGVFCDAADADDLGGDYVKFDERVSGVQGPACEGATTCGLQQI